MIRVPQLVCLVVVVVLCDSAPRVRRTVRDALVFTSVWRDYESGDFKFDAKFEILLTKSVREWRVILEFDAPVWGIEIWRADVVDSRTSSNMKRYVLKPKRFNRGFNRGKKIEMNFLAFTNNELVSGIAYLEGTRDNTLPPTTTAASATTTLPPKTTTTPTTAALPSTTTAASATTTQPPTKTTASATTTLPPTTTTASATAALSSSTTSALVTAALTSTVAPGQFNYAEVVEKSILFYEAQRSGRLPYANRIPFRFDSATNDGHSAPGDLEGGWYDAGDGVKFNFPMAYTTTVLTWGLLLFKGGYQSAGQLDNMYDSIKWPLDYFLKCHSSRDVLYGQVGDGFTDHSVWGRPSNMTMPRPAFKIESSNPGSDLAAETAAAMAAGYLAFKERDFDYAELLLESAKELYVFAKTYRGIYSEAIQNAASFYRSSGFEDELAWAAMWLYKATDDQSYLDDAARWAGTLAGSIWAFSWDDKKAGVLVLLYEATRTVAYKNKVINFVSDYWFGRNGVVRTPGQLAFRDEWGSLRYAANAAFIALAMAEQDDGHPMLRSFAKEQIHYALGDNPKGRSYVVGFGNNPPVRPHHRSSSCKLPPTLPCNWNDFHSSGPNPNVLYGALVGGPNKDDSYKDDREDFAANEVATDYNAGFQSAVAGLEFLRINGELE